MKYTIALLAHRGDTHYFQFPFTYSLSEIKDLRFEIKEKHNDYPLIRLTQADNPDAFIVDEAAQTLTLILNYGGCPEVTRTDYIYIANSVTRRELLYEIQIVFNDGVVTTLAGQRFTLRRDVITFNGNHIVEHLLQQEASQVQFLEGAALAMIPAFLNASNDPSASNPVVTWQDLKDERAIDRDVQIERLELSPQNITDREKSLAMTPDPEYPVFVFASNLQVLKIGTHYDVEGSRVKWGDWLASVIDTGSDLLAVYKSNPNQAL